MPHKPKLKIRIGSRPSQLALVQAGMMRERLAAEISGADAQIEIVEIRTSGDKLKTASLAQVGGKGLFIKELEQALAEDRIDAAVHSMKDLPAVLPAGFKVAAVPGRETTSDILVTRDGLALEALWAGARVGTSSSRRRFQALRKNRGLEVVALRGNVDTRLKRVADGSLDAIIIALAGVKRLKRLSEVKYVELDERDFIPAGCQGALAIETLAERSDEAWNELFRALGAMNDPRAFYETAAERSFLAAIGASCRTPVGVRARVAGDTLRMRAILFSPDGARELSESMEEAVFSELKPSAAQDCGRRLGERMLARGAGALLGRG